MSHKQTLYLGPVVRCGRTRNWDHETVSHVYAHPRDAGELVALGEMLNLPVGQFRRAPIPRYELRPHQRLRVARSEQVVAVGLAHESELADTVRRERRAADGR